MNKIEQFLAVREGGQVQRAHIMQFSGPYNVAIHSYNALSLLLLLYPTKPSSNLIKAVLWHDVPERWTGDVPAPAKWASPKLKDLLDDLEYKIFAKLNIADIFDGLTVEESVWLNAVDLLELYVWGIEQGQSGYAVGHGVVKRVLQLMDKKILPIEVQSFIDDFKFERHKECHELLEDCA